jgi:hypothetical protein
MVLMVTAHYSLSSSMLRPTNLSFNDQTLTWATTLSQSPEVPADASIALMIQYQKLLEDVFDVYRDEKKLKDRSRLAMHAQRMIAMLESWWVCVPSQLHLTCTDTSPQSVSSSLIVDRPLRQQILLCEDSYLRDGPTVSLPASR